VSEEKLRFICDTETKKYEIVVRCAKVELGPSKEAIVTDRRRESENTCTKRWSKECRGRAGEKRVTESEWKSPSSININAKKNKKERRQKECGEGAS
jgi:hypothetical protein